MTGIEVAVIAGTAITVGDIALVAGTALTALGAMSSANAQSNAAKYNAQLAERNAQIAQQQAAAQEDRQRRQAYLQQGSARAAYGASGVSLEGSPLDMLEQSALEAELDAQTIRWNGQVSASGYQAEAGLSNYRASTAMTQGYMGAGSAILLGAGKMEDRLSSRVPKTGGSANPFGSDTGVPLAQRDYNLSDELR